MVYHCLTNHCQQLRAFTSEYQRISANTSEYQRIPANTIMARICKHIKNDELRNLIKIFCEANSIKKIKFIYRMNKAQLYEIIEKYEIMEWILKKNKKNIKYEESFESIFERENIIFSVDCVNVNKHYKPDRYNMPNISRDNIYVNDNGTFQYLKDLNCFDTIQYVHIKNFKDDDIIEFKYKNEYDENFNKISTIYMGTIAGIGFNHKVN